MTGTTACLHLPSNLIPGFASPRAPNLTCASSGMFSIISMTKQRALQVALRPYLGVKTRAHAFAVHNLKSPRNEKCYSLKSLDVLGEKPRTQPLAGYAPHNQGQLKALLTDFDLVRNVLLSDGRLEMALGVKAQVATSETDRTRQRVIL